jgi:FAD/FMN-containing dehydrogenase
MRYGGLRDQLLALTVVLGDGRVVRAGRPVVKNVAGYDIPKVLIGSHGTLGLITEATFKISVQPRAIKSLVYPIEKIEQSLTWATTSLSQALVASAVMLCRGITASAFPGLIDLGTPAFLIYTAEGLPEDVEVELSAVQEKLSKNDAPEPILAKDVAGSDMWAKFIGINSTGILKIRTGVSPKDLPTYLLKCTKSLAVSAYIADFANGMLYASANPDGVGEAQAWVDELRKPALSAGGYTVILEAPSEWLEKLDIWGYRPNTLHIMQTLKKHWDPDGILNPGYFLNL